ncbi:MAG TPA: TerC family protein [Acidobacteriota bacterium]|nr:TerC family protein [Acidobacteriota bacterium]
MFWMWVIFHVLVLGLLAVDLGLFQRKEHSVTFRSALVWCLICISFSLVVNVFVYLDLGSTAGLEFLTGYLIELALSVDNIFVFALIFSYFKVPARFQHRVLFWGILGALVMRGTMIGVGVYLVKQFHWLLYIFGAFLIYTGYRMAKQSEVSLEPEANPVIRIVQRILPVTNSYSGRNFFAREWRNGRSRLAATPLFIVLLLIETTDLIFALDSIPAIFAITLDPFVIYTSNVCAILGLRAMYFLLAVVISKFYYLKTGLSIVLSFVGLKMLVAEVYRIPIVASLLLIALTLGLSIFVSLMFPPTKKNELPRHGEPKPGPLLGE